MSEAQEMELEIEGGEVEAPEAAPEPESQAEPAPESEAAPEPESEPSTGPKPLDSEQQEAVNRAIARKVAKQKEAERRAEDIERQLREAEERLQQFHPQQTGIPPMPDPYDADFDAKVQARDEAIKRQAAQEREQAFQVQMQQEEARRTAEREQAAMQEKASAYASRADALGVNGQDLQRAAMIVEAQGISQDVAMYIMEDERGPELTVYLGENPAEVDRLSGMTPMQAAVYMETQIKPRSRKEAPVTTPAPVTTDEGAAMPETDGGLDGLVLE